jgi:D-threo-aldose 1-dehydrogenase
MDNASNERLAVLESPSLAFGSAGAFRLPSGSERRRLLDAAYDAGFRHFDVAPMYGMGQAERELAALLAKRGSSVTVTTKFGIDASVFGRAVGKVQGPIRRVLAAKPSMNTDLQKTASGPASSAAGRLLYRPTGFSQEAARKSLQRSLHALSRGTIELFILHDPLPQEMAFAERDGTIAYLEEERAAGRIGNWGVAVHDPHLTGPDSSLIERAPFLQFRDHLFLELTPKVMTSQVATYGALAGALPRIEQFFDADPLARKRWVDELDLTESGPRSLASAILRETTRRNPFGPVLFTTTKPHRLQPAMEAIHFDAPIDESARIAQLVAEVRDQGAGA